MNYIGVIQATYHSPGFPGKVMADLAGRPALAILVERLQNVSCLNRLIIATTVESYDDVIVACAETLGVEVYRGEVADVIARVYHAASAYAPDGVCAFWGNAPLVDCDDLSKMIEEHDRGTFDFSYNEHFDGVIYGMGSTIYSFDVLQRLVQNPAITPRHREVGSLYILQRPESFTINRRVASCSRPNYKVLIDEERDQEVVKTILKYVPIVTSENVGLFLDDNPLLTESMNKPSVSEAGVEKLILFPEKIQHYQTDAFDESYPLVVELSLTNRCNLACEWCSDQKLRDTLGGELSVDVLNALLADLKKGGTRSIVIEGGGEPMLHPEFEQIIRSIHTHGFEIGLITNGVTPLAKELVPFFKWVRISLDASSREEYVDYKGADMYETVLQNIEDIVRVKQDTVVGVGYVVTQFNTQHLERLVLQLKQCGINYIQFRPVIDAPKLSGKIDLTYLRKYESGHFRVDIQAMNANQDAGNSGLACKAHSLSTVITADGGVYMCGRLNIYDWCKPIGNINQGSFDDVWGGVEHQKQSTDVLDPNYCMQYCPRCRMTKYNQLLHTIASIKTKNFI